jgi:hypothetical protein
MNDEFRKLCMCEGKVKHKTRPEAKQAKIILLRKFPGIPVSIYRCPYCKFFHVGRDHK